MYTIKDFCTKKQLKEAVASREKVRIYQPNDIFGIPEAKPHYTGWAYLEGMHYPKPHTWYAEVEVKDGLVVKVK